MHSSSPFDTARAALLNARAKELRPDVASHYTSEKLGEFGISDSAKQQEIQQNLPIIRRFSLNPQGQELSGASALILQQAIENYQVNRLSTTEATALNTEKAQATGNAAEHIALVNKIAKMRQITVGRHLPSALENAKTKEAYTQIHSQAEKAANIPPTIVATRSFKRALTERNNALHYARTDLPETATPLVTPVELEKITADARATVKASTQYVLHDHYLSVIAQDTTLPSDWAKAVAAEVTQLQHRLSTTLQPQPDANHHVTLSLNQEEAALLNTLAGNQQIHVEHEHAKIVGPDHNPLSLLTLSAEGFERLSKSFGQLPARAR